MKTHIPISRAVVTVLLATMMLAACGGSDTASLLTSAKEYLAKKDNKSAAIQLKGALQKNPDLAEARFLLGKALLDGGDPVSAELELRKALELKYPPDQVWPELIRTLLATGQSKRVIEEVAKANVTGLESKADLQNSLGVAYGLLGDVTASEKAISSALALKADFAPAQVNFARIKASAGELAGSLAMLDALLAKDSQNHEAWKVKGDVLAAQQEIDASIAAYRKSIAIKGDAIATHSSLTVLYLLLSRLAEAEKQLAELRKFAAQHPQTQFLAVQLAYLKKDYKAARESSQQLLKVFPNHASVLQQAGTIEIQLNSLVQGEDYLSKSLRLDPESVSTRRYLALTYLGMGQPAKAMAVLSPIIGQIDTSADLLALAGEVYLQNGDLKNAEDSFRKASRLDPKDPAKRTSLALIRLSKGETEAAFTELDAISASDPGITSDLALLSSHLRRGDFDKALNTIDGLEKKQPNTPFAHNLRGRILLTKRDVTGARKSFERALEISPSDLTAATSLAILDMSDKKPEAARKRYENVLAADPRNVSAMLSLAELKSNVDGPNDEVAALIAKAIATSPDDPAARDALANFHLLKKDPKKAISAGQEALAALPNAPEIYDVLGRAQRAAGETNQALSTYAKWSSIQPNSHIPFFRMAEINLAAKNTDAATVNLRKALEAKPDSVDAQRVLVAVLVSSGKQREALQVAREAQKQRPQDPVGYLLEGDVSIPGKAWAEVVKAYRAALKVAPASREVALKLHPALMAAGNDADAEKFASGWLAAYPKDLMFRLYLAEVAATRKDFAKAAMHFRFLVDAEPENPVVLNNLAWVMGRQKVAGAIEFAEKANKLAPNQPGFMDTLAMLLLEKGEVARATDMLNKAIGLAPQDANIRLDYARALLLAGKRSEAKIQLYEISKLGSKYPNQAEVSQLAKDL